MRGQTHMVVGKRLEIWAGALLLAMSQLACSGNAARPGSGGSPGKGSGGEATGGAPGVGSGGRLGSSGSGGSNLGAGGRGGGGIASSGGAVGSGGASSAAGTGGGAGQRGAGGMTGGGGATGSGASGSGGSASGGTTAGGGGAMGPGGSSGANPWIVFDQAGIVSRSNIILTKANTATSQIMPIGNGTLGAAVWAAGGFTAQLNRADTMPNRLSPGWLTIPGLAKMTGASDFRGTLNLYDGELVESGGGMMAKIYIRADSDELIVDVTGADPGSNQTATVSLWGSRNPQTAASGAVATLSESWTDGGSWASNQKFGTLAALTAGGQGVTASASGKTVTVTFKPNADGSFRIVCGSPSFNGGSAAMTAATTLLGTDATKAGLEGTHTSWWHDFWGRVGMMKLVTGDGSGEYLENIRAIFLYAHASESRGVRPGSQAGVADFFNFSQDSADWYAAGYWFWNLRMQVAASLSSGAFDLNAPVFNLYSSNVANIQAWTKSQMGGRAGICVPETMRFNGNGYWYAGNNSCDQASAPNYNALTLSSGSEISLWMWRHYLMTGDKPFLQANFPFMLEAARFLHTYATVGSSGKLQTSPSNSHEDQWSVTMPITDASAMTALFPAVVAAAQIVGSTDALISSLQSDITKLPDLPRTNTARSAVTSPSSDSTNIFAYSGTPTATVHNVENDDLEPVWPYDLVSDVNASLFQVAQRTYNARAFKDNQDWSVDAIQAARLGLASEVPARLLANIKSYQTYACGLSAWDTSKFTEPYIEESGVVAAAINEAVGTGFDGIVRVAPAIPSSWTVSGTVFLQGQARLDVQFQGGALAFAVLEAGSTGTVQLRNPWGATAATIVDSVTRQPVSASGDPLSFGAEAGHFYLIRKATDPEPATVQVSGAAATAPKHQGSRSIGI